MFNLGRLEHVRAPNISQASLLGFIKGTFLWADEGFTVFEDLLYRHCKVEARSQQQSNAFGAAKN